jgi:hypothetical protein
VEVHDAGAVFIARQVVEMAALAHRAGRGGAVAQPFVEGVAVDHADEAIFDRDVHALIAGRHHAGAPDARHEQVFRDGEVLDQARRDGAAAGLGAAVAVQQHHRVAALGQVVGCRGTCRAAAHHDHVKGVRLGSRASSWRPGAAAVCIKAGTAMRAANTAATTNNTASPANTLA